MRRCQPVCAVIALALSFDVAAQSTKRPSFEVASIRLTQPRTTPSQRVTATRLSLLNQQLRSVLLMAFKLTPFQLSAPDWLREVRVDIHATIPVDAEPQQWREMLQTLLVDRFGLFTHVESRPVNLYELSVGQGGITMREVEPVDELGTTFGDAALPNTPVGDVVMDTLDGQVRTMVVPLGTRTITARTRYERRFTERRTTQINAIRMTMGELATILASNVDEPVLDKTGLTGVYQFTLELPADASAIRVLRNAGITTTVQGTPLDEPTGVSVFKAVEGLGLKLERRRSPYDVVVVDKMQRAPTEN